MGLHDEVSVRDDERGVGPPLPCSLSLVSCTRAQVKAFAGSLCGKPMQVAVVVCARELRGGWKRGTCSFVGLFTRQGKLFTIFDVLVHDKINTCSLIRDRSSQEAQNWRTYVQFFDDLPFHFSTGKPSHSP